MKTIVLSFIISCISLHVVAQADYHVTWSSATDDYNCNCSCTPQQTEVNPLVQVPPQPQEYRYNTDNIYSTPQQNNYHQPPQQQYDNNARQQYNQGNYNQSYQNNQRTSPPPQQEHVDFGNLYKSESQSQSQVAYYRCYNNNCERVYVENEQYNQPQEYRQSSQKPSTERVKERDPEEFYDREGYINNDLYKQSFVPIGN